MQILGVKRVHYGELENREFYLYYEFFSYDRHNDKETRLNEYVALIFIAYPFGV